MEINASVRGRTGSGRAVVVQGGWGLDRPLLDLLFSPQILSTFTFVSSCLCGLPFATKAPLSSTFPLLFHFLRRGLRAQPQTS